VSYFSYAILIFVSLKAGQLGEFADKIFWWYGKDIFGSNRGSWNPLWLGYFVQK